MPLHRGSTAEEAPGTRSAVRRHHRGLPPTTRRAVVRSLAPANDPARERRHRRRAGRRVQLQAEHQRGWALGGLQLVRDQPRGRRHERETGHLRARPGHRRDGAHQRQQRGRPVRQPQRRVRNPRWGVVRTGDQRQRPLRRVRFPGDEPDRRRHEHVLVAGRAVIPPARASVRTSSFATC